MEDVRADICVIGAGSGGLSVAAGAAQMGARVVLLEGNRMGGDCLNYGCVPSKALLAAAKAAQAHRRGAGFGITPHEPQIDYAGAMDHVARAIATIAPHDSVARFEGLGVRVIGEYGRFESRGVVIAGTHRITARRFVIATGSSPLVPPIPGLEGVPYLTNETLFDLRRRPEHLLIIGAGPVGLEMAQAHRRLGGQVTVIEGARALGREDPEAAALVLAQLRGEGVEVLEGAEVVRVAAEGDGARVTLADGRGLAGTHLLIAVGRKPNLAGLNLDAAGIAHTAAGVTVNDALRTNNRRVYAIGDVAGRGQFTHLAGYHAGVVIRAMLFGLPARARADHIPRVTYTDPELAQIGLTEVEARERHGRALQVIRLGLDGNDRAITEGAGAGFIKLMVHKGRAAGVTLVGPGAGEQVGVWALILANRSRLSALAGTVLPYPTLTETSKRAAGTYFSPRLFDNPVVKRVVGLVQRLVP